MPPEAMDLVIQRPGGRGWNDRVRGSEFNEAEFFRAIAGSGARDEKDPGTSAFSRRCEGRTSEASRSSRSRNARSPPRSLRAAAEPGGGPRGSGAAHRRSRGGATVKALLHPVGQEEAARCCHLQRVLHGPRARTDGDERDQLKQSRAAPWPRRCVRAACRGRGRPRPSRLALARARESRSRATKRSLVFPQSWRPGPCTTCCNASGTCFAEGKAGGPKAWAS